MPFDGWKTAGKVAGSLGLGYLAGNRVVEDGPAVGQQSFRLSLDKQGSFLGDVRIWGALGTGIAAGYVKNKKAAEVLEAVAEVTAMSLAVTEGVRFAQVRGKLLQATPIFPKIETVAGMGQPRQVYAQQRPAWAYR